MLIPRILMIVLSSFKTFILTNKRLIFNYIGDIKGTVNDYYYDKKLGIDTYGNCYSKEDKSIYGDESIYQPVDYFTLNKIITYLQLNDNDVFIDLGCGKGRAVFFAATMKLKKVIGIELRKTMVEAAKSNLETFKLKNTEIEIIHTDACNYDMKEGTVFFMLNPFGFKTLMHVLDNIKKSLEVSPRRIRIVYIGGYIEILDTVNWLTREGKVEVFIIFCG